jgi:uncharacterized protein (TIGR03437 family)
LACASLLVAAPKLRLSTAAVGPILIVPGQNGAAQSVDSANVGDGTLNLMATANVPWIVPTITGSKSCTIATTCRGVQLALNTASLAKGIYTGLVTVADPNAIDSPQTITVTVAIGSAIPDTIDLYLTPGGSAKTNFTSVRLNASVSNPASGPKFSLGASGGGSFDFAVSYLVSVNAPAGTAESDYQGNIAIASSTFSPDVKRVALNAHVTSQPIVAASPASVLFRIAQGGAPDTKGVALANSGLGTLALSATTASPAASWLTAKVSGTAVLLTADPTGLNPGTYQTTLSIASNARNGPTAVPVELDVLTPGPPVTYYQGVLDNAIFLSGGALAPGEIVAAFGEQLTKGPPASASKLPLDTTLNGTSVFVNGSPAPVYYASNGQVNFQIPYNVPAGDAVFRIDRDGQRGNSVSATMLPVVPAMLRLGIGDYGIVVINDPVLTFAIPTTPGVSSRPAKAGQDVITLYALGLGQTTPPVTAGVAAPVDPLAIIPNVKVIFGYGVVPNSGHVSDVLFAGLTPGLVGLYQINVLVPVESPRGDQVVIFFTVNGTASNRVNIAVQ